MAHVDISTYYRVKAHFPEICRFQRFHSCISGQRPVPEVVRCTCTEGDPRGPRAASLSTARTFARFCCPGQRSGRAGPRMTESRHGGRAQLFCAVSRYQSYGTDPYGWFTAEFALNRSSDESRRPIPSPRACSRNATLSGKTCSGDRVSGSTHNALYLESIRWVRLAARAWRGS